MVNHKSSGAFSHTDLELLLRLRGIKNLVIAGVTTDVCVTGTMREANDRGLDCLLVEDGAAASEDELHVAACRMVRCEGGIFGATARLEHIVKVIESCNVEGE